MTPPDLTAIYLDLEARVRVLERKSDVRVAVVAGLTSIIMSLVAALVG